MPVMSQGTAAFKSGSYISSSLGSSMGAVNSVVSVGLPNRVGQGCVRAKLDLNRMFVIYSVDPRSRMNPWRNHLPWMTSIIKHV